KSAGMAGPVAWRSTVNWTGDWANAATATHASTHRGRVTFICCSTREVTDCQIPRYARIRQGRTGSTRARIFGSVGVDAGRRLECIHGAGFGDGGLADGGLGDDVSHRLEVRDCLGLPSGLGLDRLRCGVLRNVGGEFPNGPNFGVLPFFLC